MRLDLYIPESDRLLSKEGHNLMIAIHEARVQRAAPPQTITRLEKERASADAAIHQVNMATNKLLGLA